MAKDELIERATGGRISASGPSSTSAPAAVDEIPTAEDAAKIAASTVFEPDEPVPAAGGPDGGVADDATTSPDEATPEAEIALEPEPPAAADEGTEPERPDETVSVSDVPPGE